MMLEVLGRGLHGVDDVLGRELLSKMPRNADKQPTDQSELRGENGEAPAHGLRSELGVGSGAEGKFHAQLCVDRVVFQDLRMEAQERRKVSLVCASAPCS